MPTLSTKEYLRTGYAALPALRRERPGEAGGGGPGPSPRPTYPAYLAEHLPAWQQDFVASPVREPQQLAALPQQAAPALQQGWAPVQQDFTCWQQSLPLAQQPSLTAALQQAASLSQQLSFLPQQSFGAASGADWAGAAKNRAADRAATANRFENMALSTKDVWKSE